MSTFTATKIIGIDMGHRVTNHGSKCKSIHGHRYTIEATVESDKLQTSGEQEGMVYDFGFLKDIMLDTIDRICDHGMCLWEEDPLLPLLYPEAYKLLAKTRAADSQFFPAGTCAAGKLVVVPFVPTAENLAKWWYELLEQKTPIGVNMKSVKVWETPFCYSIYPG
jgi:6-pyruvoyltetrahydropterin/6-carboxytetrahydropterin synthase